MSVYSVLLIKLVFIQHTAKLAAMLNIWSVHDSGDPCTARNGITTQYKGHRRDVTRFGQVFNHLSCQKCHLRSRQTLRSC